MKLKTGHIKYILIAVILIIFAETLIYSQDSIRVESKRPGLYSGISIGPSKNHIINNGTVFLTGLSSSYKNSISGSFELGYSFSKSFGLSTGLEYDTYSTQLLLDSYSDEFITTDPENEPYERHVAGSGIKELQEISFLSVPFCLNFQIPFGNRFGLYLQTGVSLSFPLSNQYSNSGTFSFAGYFPAYNVLFQNLPEYGFPSDSNISSNGTLDLKSNYIDGVAQAGFQLFITEKMQISLGIVYKRSLSGISKYDAPDNFHLSSDINQINSMMGGTSEAIAESMGLRVSFRYYFK
jgi:hypothetical protein